MAMPKEIEKRIADDYYQRGLKLDDLKVKYALRDKSLKAILRQYQPEAKGS